MPIKILLFISLLVFKTEEEKFYEGEPVNSEALKRQEQVVDPWSREDIPMDEASEARETKQLIEKQQEEAKKPINSRP